MVNKSIPLEYSIYEDDVDGIEIDLSSLFFDIEEEPLAFSYDNHMNFSMYIQNDILKIVSVKNWCGAEIIEVTANDSWSDTTVELSIKILPVNDPPTNFIISYNTSYTQNETIRFEASASDPDIEYGDVINITWSESSIGEIGYGGNIKPKFEPGSYNVTVKVEDACGEYLLKSFQINISSLSDINNSDDDNDENNTESKDDDNIIIFIILTLIIIISLVCVVVFVYAIFRYKKNNSNNDNEREEESDDISTDNADEDVIAK